MKKYAITLLCAALMCGCSDNSGSPHADTEPVSTAAFDSAETTVTMTEAETTAEITTQAVTQPAKKKVGYASYSITDERIELSMNGETVTTLTHDPPLPEHGSLTVHDFDFDGYDDVFIPDHYNGDWGTYYHYLPESREFVVWEEMFAHSSKAYLAEIGDDNTLTMTVYDIYSSQKYVDEWKDGKLSTISYDDQYYNEYAITDHYEYRGGEPVLVYRQYTNSNTGAKFRYEEYPVYFRVTENSILVMQEEKLLQKIENVELYSLVEQLEEFNANKTVVTLDFGVTLPEHYINNVDFDFDGYKDLAYPIDNYYVGGKNVWTYFRYDPEAEQFVPWEELNEIGDFLYIEDDETLTQYTMTTEPTISYSYGWEDGQLKLRTRKESLSDGDGGYDEYIYEYDENGTDRLAKRIHHALGSITSADVYIYDEFGNETLETSTGGDEN